MSGGGLVIGGARVEVPGVDVTTWLDDPHRAPRITDGSRRTTPPVAFVLHTSRGRRSTVKPGARAGEKAAALARYQARTKRKVSWHLTVGTAGDVYQQEDLATWTAWHVEEANGWTVGAELAQERDDASLWSVQIDAMVAVVEASCAALSIPRRVLVGPDGAPWVRPVPSLVMRKYDGPGERWAGVLGHCQLVPDDVRGPGDPGDGIFRALLDAGFEGVPVAGVASSRPTLPPRAPASAAASDERIPSWVDREREITPAADVVTTPEAFARGAWEHLQALGVPREAALEVIAHCAVECSWGRRAIGSNCGGVKLKRRDDDAHRAKHGRGLAWWRDAGHVESGDDPVEVYRGFEGPADFWAFLLKRYAPRPDLPAESERYEDAGAAFWSDRPRGWFVELVLAGYRGEVRASELEAILAAHLDAEEHKSVARHRQVVARVREMLGG